MSNTRSREVTPLEKLKLAILSLDDFKDEEVGDMVLGFEVAHEDEILEIVGMLREHRPQILATLSQKFFHKNAA